MNKRKLSEIVIEIRNGLSVKQSEDQGGLAISRIETISDGSVNTEKVGRAGLELNNGTFDEDKYLLKHNDILVSHINSPKHLGKCAIYKEETGVLVHGINLLRVRPNQSLVDAEYLHYYLKGKAFRRDILTRSNQSVNQASFSSKSLGITKIPLHPLPEQRRIAARLDAADRLRRLDVELVAKYDELKRSLFLEMFGDWCSNISFSLSTIEEIACKIVDCPHSTPSYEPSSTAYPCIRTTDISGGNISWTKMKYLSAKGHQDRNKRLTPVPGDIIYGREGSYGDAIIVPNDCNVSLGQRVMLIRPKNEMIDSRFLHAAIRSDYIYRQAVKCNTGSTVGHVNMKDIRKFSIPLPPLALQHEFASRIVLLDRQQELVRDAQGKGEEIFLGVMGEVF